MLVLHMIKCSHTVADKALDYHQRVFLQIAAVLGLCTELKRA